MNLVAAAVAHPDKEADAGTGEIRMDSAAGAEAEAAAVVASGPLAKRRNRK